MKRQYTPKWGICGWWSMLILLLLAKCQTTGADSITASPATTEGKKMNIQISCPAFAEGKTIPAKYTGEGEDISPPLKWSAPPVSTKSIALICDDPDAPVGTWVHWVIYNLPATANELPEKLPAVETLPNGAKQGFNDFRRFGYGGPMPPPGPRHRYYFKLYALDTELKLGVKATKRDVERAMQNHVLAQGQLMGIYQRR